MATYRGAGGSYQPEVLRRGARSMAPGKRRDTGQLPSTASVAEGIVCTTCSELTERQLLAAIVDGSEDAIISKTLEGTVNSWNSGATQIFGYTFAEMVGTSISRLVPAELQAEEAQILAKLARGDRIDHYETVRVAKDGHHVHVSLAVAPIRDATGKIIGASKTARDISSRKAADELLRLAKASAERSHVDADNAIRAKTDFLATMSHEIRTPLNSIDGFLWLLTKTDGLTPEQLRYADLMKNATTALRHIVDDILDYSKVEASGVVLESHPFNLSTLIHDTIALVEPLARAKNLELTSAIDVGATEWMLGDQRRLGQVLLNLLANAVKFTTEGSVKLAARSQVDADGREQVFFSVTDTGLGVAEEHLNRLFKPFLQAHDSVGRLHGGTGLGLAICKRLVELMHGEIGIVSEVGRGSNVSFTACLPRVCEPPQESADERPVGTQTESDKIGARKFRVLVVDDIDTNLEIFEAILRVGGHDVVSVNSGLGALQELASRRFDLVLMDIQMPMMDGVTATRCIRTLPAPIGTIPVIAMTAHVLPEHVKTFLAAGMDGHIGKPIDCKKLLDVVRRWQLVADRVGVSVEPNSCDFDPSAFDAFVLAVGANKAMEIANMFLASLSSAFQSTFSESKREAHGLINAAGTLGQSGFVAACRQIAEVDSSQERELGDQVVQALQRAQSIARQALTEHLLPRLH